MKRPLLTLFALVALLGSAFPTHARTIRVFVIGNSFSNNALLYLPKIVQSAGDQIVVKSASIGGSPLEKHWNGVAAASLADPDAKEGKVYGGKSLNDLLGDTRWDVVTIQQYSMDSPNPETYQPYATKLRDYVRKRLPQAQVVLHQTWAYRVDSRDWGFVRRGERAKDQTEMWLKSRAAPTFGSPTTWNSASSPSATRSALSTPIPGGATGPTPPSTPKSPGRPNCPTSPTRSTSATTGRATSSPLTRTTPAPPAATWRV